MKWHPIKTAPKDREVLLYYPPGTLGVNVEYRLNRLKSLKFEE